MSEAFMSYEGAAGPASGVTSAYGRFCGTADTIALRAYLFTIRES
jgi:hypothetical protein